MNISLVHYHLGQGGGMERYLRDLLAGLHAAGDTTRVAAQKVDAEAAAALGTTTELLPAPRHPRLLGKILFYRRAARWLRTQAAAGPAVTLARVPGAWLAIPGGTHLGWLRATGRWRRPGDQWELFMERNSYRTARRVMAMSEMMRRELMELYGVPAQKIRVASLPVDTRRFHPGLRAERAVLRRKFGFNDGRLRLLFPSGGHRRKGLDLLIEAARLLPPGRFEVVLAGARPSPRYAGAVNYLGYVREMEQLYAACDATVMPSRYEPLGLVYLESVLCGTPAVLPHTAGAAEILGEPQAVVIAELTPGAVAAAVQQVAARSAPELDLSFVARHELEVSAHTAKVRSWLDELSG